jgi:hypothetical protein
MQKRFHCDSSLITNLISFGACSPSRTSQSKPASPSTSVLIGLASADQQPICISFAASAAT